MPILGTLATSYERAESFYWAPSRVPISHPLSDSNIRSRSLMSRSERKRAPATLFCRSFVEITTKNVEKWNESSVSHNSGTEKWKLNDSAVNMGGKTLLLPKLRSTDDFWGSAYSMRIVKWKTGTRAKKGVCTVIKRRPSRVLSGFKYRKCVLLQIFRELCVRFLVNGRIN